MKDKFYVLNMDKYYYSDALFQLEINLHNIRKELISMIEHFEQTDCSECLQLKCRCSRKETKSDSGSCQSDVSGQKSPKKDKCLNAAPSAEVLPKPDFNKKVENEKSSESPAPLTPEKDSITQDIEAWIRASKKAGEDELKKLLSVINPKNSLVTIESIRPADQQIKAPSKASFLNNTAFVNYTIHNAVDSFFKYFKSPIANKQTETKVVYTSTSLAAAYSKSVKQSYSYF